MHQAMAKALVKAQRRATAPQSTGRRREKRPCTDIVPHTAPQSAVPMDNGATGAVGLELRVKPIAKKAQLFFYGESGATGSTAIKFALEGAGTDETDINIGDLGYGGSYFRVGAGMKF